MTVTFCPLCNSALVFDRVVDGTTLDFGTSGKLYRSDLVMYDRQTHSLWAQMEGRAIVGAKAGARLGIVPATTIAYEDWKAAHPTGKVLSRETGHQRPYELVVRVRPRGRGSCCRLREVLRHVRPRDGFALGPRHGPGGGGA